MYKFDGIDMFLVNGKTVLLDGVETKFKNVTETLAFILKKVNKYNEKLINKIQKNIEAYESIKSKFNVQQFKIEMLNPLRQALEFYERAEGKPNAFYGCLLKIVDKNKKLEAVLLEENYHLVLSHEVNVDTLVFDEQRFKRFCIYSDKDLIKRKKDGEPLLKYKVFLNGEEVYESKRLADLYDLDLVKYLMR